jgi:uncharacterized protein (DUF3084 family)
MSYITHERIAELHGENQELKHKINLQIHQLKNKNKELSKKDEIIKHLKNQIK